MNKLNHKCKNFMMAIVTLLVLLLPVNIGIANELQQTFGVSLSGKMSTTSLLDTPRIGGVSISAIPRASNVTVDKTLKLDIKAKNTQNVRDKFRIYISLDNISSVYKPDVSWFYLPWRAVTINPGSDITVPLYISIPGDASGVKIFHVRIQSMTSTRVYAYDTGYLKIV